MKNINYKGIILREKNKNENTKTDLELINQNVIVSTDPKEYDCVIVKEPYSTSGVIYLYKDNEWKVLDV